MCAISEGEVETMRCQGKCGKVIYTAETTAQLACVRAALTGDASLSWYYSQACGAWHLTTTVKRGHKGKRVQWVKGFETVEECAA